MSGWSDLVTAALLGTDRREIPSDLPGDLASFAARIATADPSARLLDLAAGYTAYARAGAVLQGCPTPSRAPAADGEPAPPAAQRVLRALLNLRAPLLVREWLQLCADCDRRAAPDLWTALADLASDGGVDPHLVRAALGARGVWFLSHNPRWHRLLEAAPTASTDVHARGSGVLGTATSDTAVFEDPDELRAQLDRDWSRGRAERKVAMLRSLARDLALDDEPRLMRALRDRSAEVREEAARLLAGLPESEHARRVTARATAAVTVTRSLGRRKVVVTAPEADAALADDGIALQPPRSFPGGPGAFVLRQVLAATPLSAWTATTGLAPSELLDLVGRTSGDWLADLRAGWAVAARRQGDAAWAEALLSAGEVDEALVGLVSPATRVQVAVAWATQSADPKRAAELMLACPRPWPADLTTAALRIFSSGSLGPSSRHFAEEAAHAMGIESYQVLGDHVLGWVPRRDMSAHEKTQVRAGHVRMEELLALRIAIHHGFADEPMTVRRFAVPHRP